MNIVKEAIEQLNELAKTQTQIKNKFLDNEEQRLQNLVLIFIFRDWNSISHWATELFATCNKTFKWTNTNTWMPEKKLKEFLVDPWEDAFLETNTVYVEEAVIHEQKYTNKEIRSGNYNPNNLHDFIVEYNLWLANKLSINGRVLLEEVFQEIDKLLDKYPKE